jgi:4-hydroxy-4-methyl-2-oxoglutarate aldolase
MRTDAVAGELVTRLKALDCCAVSDTLDKLGLTGVVTGLSQLSSTRRIAGRVLTFKLGVGAPATGVVRHNGTTAIMLAQPGDIIVVEQRSGIHAASWGGILSLGAKLRGIAGVIAEGLLRDADEARQHDFPVFARGVTPVTARGRIVEISNNEPVRVGDVEVKPGDYAIADGSGVVFVAADNIERVLKTAEEIVAREASMAKALYEGKPITEVMGASYEHMLRN